MDCNSIVLLLPEFLTNRLSDTEKRSVQEHLNKCESCKRELAEIRDLMNFTEANTIKTEESLEEFFNEFWSNLYKRIQYEGLNKTKTLKHNILRFLTAPFRLKAYQLASLPAILILGILLFYSIEKDRESPNEFSLAKKFSSALSSQLNLSLLRDRSDEKLTLPELIESVKDSSNEVTINWKEVLNSKKRSDAYESFTDFVANIVIEMR